MSRVLHEPPQEWLDNHVATCQRKPRPRHCGLASRKRRCGRELYSEIVEHGFDPNIIKRRSQLVAAIREAQS